MNKPLLRVAFDSYYNKNVVLSKWPGDSQGWSYQKVQQ